MALRMVQAHGAPRASWPERVYTNLQQGLFGLGFTFSKDVAEDSRWMFLLFAAVAEMQTMSFVLNDSGMLPWRASRVFAPIVSSISFLGEPFDPERNPTGYFVVLTLGASYVAAFLALAGSAARNFVLEQPQAPYLIKALRLVASASTGVLFLPISGFLLRGASCPNEDRQWLRTGIDCGSPAHMVLSTIFSLLTLGFSALSLFVAAVFVDRRPDSPAWGAMSTGRAAVINLLMRLGLSFSFSILRNQVVGTTGFSLLLLFLGLAKVYQYAVWAPYTHRDINSFFAASGAAFSVASGSLLVAQYVGSEAASMGILAAVPLAAIATFNVVSRRLDAVGRQPLQKCASVTDMHLWGRRRLQRRAVFKQVLERVSTDGEAYQSQVHVPGRRGGGDGLEAKAGADLDSGEQYSGGGGSSSSVTGGGKDSDTEDGASIMSAAPEGDGASVGSSRRRVGRGHREAAGGIPGRLGGADYRGVHLSGAEHLTAEQLRAEIVLLEQEARRAYEGAAETFSTDEQAFIGLSIFERSTSRYRYRECVALSQVLKCSPPLDSRYYIAQRVRDMRESDGVGLSSVDRVLFDSALRETSQLRVAAYQLLVRMFTHLTVDCPDLSDLLDTSVALHTTVERADEAYRRLFSFHSDNATLLRQYASYLSDFRADQTRVTELLNQAQRVQEQSRKQKQKVLRAVKFGAVQQDQSLFDESAAIITISAAPFRLGQILHASQSACRLFNFAPHQIIGQNVSIIVPHPLDTVHNQMLQAFSKRNRRSRVVGQTRLLFGRRKGGSILPIYLAVNEAPPDQATAEPRISAEISQVTTEQNFVLFGGSQQNFQIYSATPGSLALIGVEPEDLEQDVISMSQYFPSVESTFREHVQLSTEHIRAVANTPGVVDLFQCLGRAEVLRKHAQGHGGRSRVKMMGEVEAGGRNAGAGSERTRDTEQARHHPKLRRGSSSLKDLRGGAAGGGVPVASGSFRSGGGGHFVQGSGKTAQIKEATSGPCANEALLRSMQHLHKPGLIPVRTRSGENLVVGQVQVARVSIFGTLNILGWHAVRKPQAAAQMKRVVSLVGAANKMHSSDEEKGTKASSNDVGDLGITVPSRLEAVSPIVAREGAGGASIVSSAAGVEGGARVGKTPDSGRSNPQDRTARSVGASLPGMVEEADVDGHGAVQGREEEELLRGSRGSNQEDPMRVISSFGTMKEGMVSKTSRSGSGDEDDGEEEERGTGHRAPGSRAVAQGERVTLARSRWQQDDELVDNGDIVAQEGDEEATEAEEKGARWSRGAGAQGGRALLRGALRPHHRLVEWKQGKEPDSPSRRLSEDGQLLAASDSKPSRMVDMSEEAPLKGRRRDKLDSMMTDGGRHHDDADPGQATSEHGAASTSGRSALGSAMAMAGGSTESQIAISNRFLGIQAIFVIIMGVVVTVWTRNFVTVLNEMTNAAWLVGRRQLALLSAENKLVWMANRNDIPFLSHYEPTIDGRTIQPAAYLHDAAGPGRRLNNYNLTLVNREALHDPIALQGLMLIDADEVQDANGRLYVAIDQGGIPDYFELTAKLPILLPEETGGGSQTKTVAEQLHELVAAYRRVAKGAVAAVTRRLRDVQFVMQNAEELDLMMSFATRRHKVRLETDIEEYGMQVLLFGAVTTGIMLLVGGSSFVVLLRQLGLKTERVLQVFMMISQAQAKRLTQYSQRSLQGVLNETQQILEDESGEESDGQDFDDDALEDGGLRVGFAESDAMLGMDGASGIYGGAGKVSGKMDSGVSPLSGGSDKPYLQLQSGLKTSEAKGSAVGRAAPHKGVGVAERGDSVYVGTKSMRQARQDMQQRALDKAKANLRPYSNSSTYVCRSIICLLLPVSTVLLFAGALLLIQVELGRDIGTLVKRVVAAQSLQGRTQLLSTRMQIMAEDVYKLHHAPDTIDTDEVRANIERQAIKIATGTRIIEQLTSMVTFGGEASADMFLFADGERGELLYNTTLRHTMVRGIKEKGGLPTESGIYHVLHRDGCAPVNYLQVDIESIVKQTTKQAIVPPTSPAHYVEQVMRDCYALQDGIVAEGLVAAVTSWTFEARDFASKVYGNVTGGGRVQDVLEETDLNTPRFLREILLGDEDADTKDELVDTEGGGGWSGLLRRAWRGRVDKAEAEAARAIEEAQPSLSVARASRSTRGLQQAEIGSADLPVGRNRTLGSLDLAEYCLYEADKLRDMFSPYMQHATDVAHAQFYMSMMARLHDTGRNSEIATWVFAGFFTVTTLIYMAQLKLLQLPLQSARQMLVLLPQPLLQTHIALQAAVKEATREMQSGAGTDLKSGSGSEGGALGGQAGMGV